MVDSVLSKLTGVLLRSGRSGDYSSLGEAGQPVFRVAGQLREALRRKLGFIEGVSGPTYADHFAVPKTDQLGDVIDWYSNYPGDVIPWSSATEDERDLARDKLRALEQKVNQYCDGFNALLEERNSSARSAPVSLDAQVFNKLLSKVLHTPDANHIYLVNGFPVLTFWGFVFPKASVPTDPLLHLFNAPQAHTPAPSVSLPVAIETVALTPVSEPVIATEVVKRSWWLRWLWLLPLLLLLLWLLFGLRYCSPQMANSLGLPDLSLHKPNIDFPGFPKLPDLASKDFTLPGGGVSGTAADANGLDGNSEPDALPDMSEQSANDTPEAELNADSPELPEADLSDPALPVEPPELPDEAPSVEPPQLPQDQEIPADNPASARGQDLQIPPSIPDGQADFLNGKWKAGAGIQDKNTGKPLRLEYEFNNGKGQVTVQSTDGMRCTGDVNAEMASGSMRINSLGAARCADGSSFDMPEITCAPGAKTAADCTGNYADARFPMSMRNTQ